MSKFLIYSALIASTLLWNISADAKQSRKIASSEEEEDSAALSLFKSCKDKNGNAQNDGGLCCKVAVARGGCDLDERGTCSSGSCED